MIHGLVLGVAVFLAAEWLVPLDVRTPGIHDLRLATRLGLILPPLVGLWLGRQFRSSTIALVGVLVGLVVGSIYGWLCNVSYDLLGDFFHIQVTFPSICGAVYAGLVPSKPADWSSGLLLRLFRGLLAGFALGAVYMLVLNVGAFMVLGYRLQDTVDSYVSMMWRVGPIALGLATALFLPLLRWAIGQTTDESQAVAVSPMPGHTSDTASQQNGSEQAHS